MVQFLAMQLSHSWPRKYLRLSAQHRYPEEDLLAQVKHWYNRGEAIFLHLQGGQICLLKEEEFSLACRIVASEHDDLIGSNIPDNDGWARDTAQMWEDAETHMNASDSEVESCSDGLKTPPLGETMQQ